MMESLSTWPESDDYPQRSSFPRIPPQSHVAARPKLGSRQNSSASLSQLIDLLGDNEEDQGGDYGITEVRDGFFDSVFLTQTPQTAQNAHGPPTLPVEFDKRSPLTLKYFLPRQAHELHSLGRRVTTTWAGVRLLKSFVAIFAAYVLCLVPSTRWFLGDHHSIFVVSVILNQPARPFGSQLDGVAMTIAGTAAGLAWGVIGLLLSTSTLAASAGYGGILAMFLALFVIAIAWIRAFSIRFYQAVICAGIAIVYTTLAETSSHEIKWAKLLHFFIPWSLGQALALVINCIIFPDAGARPIARCLHYTFELMEEFLSDSERNDTRLRSRLSKAYVMLSDMYRDMVLDVTISHFDPDDIRELRNLMQATVRALLSMGTERFLSQPSESVVAPLSTSTNDLLACMQDAIRSSDAALLEISGPRKYFGFSNSVSIDLAAIQVRMQQYLATFDVAETNLLNSGELPDTYTQEHAFVQSLIAARRTRETAATVQRLIAHVASMQMSSSWPKLHLPSYPISKALFRTNAQIRHDRGGHVAGSYQVTFAQIERALEAIKSTAHSIGENTNERSSRDADRPAKSIAGATGFRYGLWRFLYRLQGYESQYALKACIVVSLLSVPSYLHDKNSWWDRYEAWWAVALSWILMHTRVGGNLQDLVSRSFFAILGAAWSAAGYAAGHGNPYVMGIFAALYLLPMTYRFTQSTHPRSGLVGCLSFVVISLSLHGEVDVAAHGIIALRKGVVFLVGTVVPVLINWLLWPFVARHELRYALSSMLFYMSIFYRRVNAQYVHFQDDDEPVAEDVQKSELLEGRLREGFVRIRQLLVLTRHEARLRATFDPVAYSSLVDACERFFEHVIAIRQSALFYNSQKAQKVAVSQSGLLSYKRDSVAAVMGNLYVLAGALRSHRKVPRYLPSAAASRKALLIRASQAEEQFHGASDASEQAALKEWRDIYRYSFDQNLTGCVIQLEEMERQTKLIVGEQGFDDYFWDGAQGHVKNE